MARLRYYPTPADFGMGFGAEVPLLDEAGAPIGELVGRTAVVPSASVSFEVCTSDDYGTVTTDLLDGAGDPITVWSTSTDFVTLGRGPVLQGPDGHVGPLYLTPDTGTTFYRIEPDSTEVYARLAAAELALAEIVTTDLQDWSDTAPTDGQIPVFNNATGEWTPGAAAGTGTVTSVNAQSPDAGGAVTLTPANISAATAADMAVLKERGYIGLAYTGSGYEAKPNGFTLGIRRGPIEPTSNMAVGDIWLQPESS